MRTPLLPIRHVAGRGAQSMIDAAGILRGSAGSDRVASAFRQSRISRRWSLLTAVV